MTPRVRRVVTVALLVTLVLLLGRVTVAYLTKEEWAAAISPAAALAVRRWQLFGLLLDAAATLVASAWFAAHAILLARSIASVQVQRQVDGRAVRQLIPMRVLLLGAAAAGVLLGVLTGAGAAAWRDAVALAWHGVTYGIIDPVMKVDIGVYIAQLPAWSLAHEFAALLIGLALLFLLSLYLVVGAFRRNDGRIEVHPYARRHLGVTLGAAALVIAWGYLLSPYRLAIAQASWISPAALETRIVATQFLVGIAVAVALLTMRWAFVGRHTLLFASWGVLLGTALIERTVLPVFVAGTIHPTDDSSDARKLASRLYGITLRSNAGHDADSGVTGPDRWDLQSLRRQVESRGGKVMLIAPQAGEVPAWGIITGEGGGTSPALSWIRVAPDTVSIEGTAVPIGSPIRLAGPRIAPGHSAWSVVDSGVNMGGLLHRIALVWARQAPGMMQVSKRSAVDWWLDPTERMESLIPTVAWRLANITSQNGEARWVLSGFAVVPGVPFGTPSAFGGEVVSGVAPAFIATIGVQSGTVHVWLDPAADSLGHALGAIHRPLVDLDGTPPPTLVRAVGYPLEWFAAQIDPLRVITGGRPLLEDGRAIDPISTTSGDGGAVQYLLRDPRSEENLLAIRGHRRNGIPELRVESVAHPLATELAKLGSAWRATAGFSQLYDSLRATGDTMLAGPLHWDVAGNRLTLWREFGSAGRAGPARLLWTGIASDRGVDGQRAALAGWDDREGPADSTGKATEVADLGRLTAARGWMLRADSALARGDMTAFGRAWEALRALLRDSPPE